MPPQFRTLDDVAEILATSRSQVYALVRNKHLRAVKIGGRGQWRVSDADLDAYIEQLHKDTDSWIDTHPYTGGEDDEPNGIE